MKYCDFCIAENPIFHFIAMPINTLIFCNGQITNLCLDEDWWACHPCATLIYAGKLKELSARAIAALPSEPNLQQIPYIHFIHHHFMSTVMIPGRN